MPQYEVEEAKSFSESLIWDLNRAFYEKEGVEAWRTKNVPHSLTSNSMVGKTYAELIFAFLKDLSYKGQTQEKVYILELGAGHGRLSFHILKHLERLIDSSNIKLPPYCFIISDIVESGLSFFLKHHQFQPYFDQGKLDVAYYDAMVSETIQLRYSAHKITPNSLNQPFIAIGNYFFDSMPTDLFHFQNHTIKECLVRLSTNEKPKDMDAETLLPQLKADYSQHEVAQGHYQDSALDELLQAYQKQVFDTYLFFPKIGLECIKRLRKFSSKGFMLLSMDKGFHEIYDLENAQLPEIITHGSFSIWVNYHALGAYCEQQGGKAIFPSFSTFHLQLGCLMFLENTADYNEVKMAYQRVVDDFGPDDFWGLKKLTYKNMANLNFLELLSVLRLSAYDSTFFTKMLPRFKQIAQRISYNERKRLRQTLHQVWEMYFTIYESVDLAYELAGIFYDLGLYDDALIYFQYSTNLFGAKPDVYYNQILCYYQLRQDKNFARTLQKAKLFFPDYERFAQLDKLDLNAK